MDKYILQYFVFNEKGTDILEANAFILSSESELKEFANTMIRNYRKRPHDEEWQLMLVNNTTGRVLFNSKEEK